MRVLIAPDKFKGSLTATTAAEAIKIGVERAWPNAEITVCPIADGGDGFLDAVSGSTADSRVHTVTILDALRRERPARFITTADAAYLEAAEAVSITHQTPTPQVALAADSYGVGQLIHAALATGARRVVVGLGGSSTTDGGLGMLRALGARPLTANNTPTAPGGGALVDLDHIDLTGLDQRLAPGSEIELVAAVDVANPLLGPDGAAHVYAPQKGADPEAVKRLATGLQRLRDAVLAETGTDLDMPGGGAAGGLGAALGGVLGATLTSGADLVLDMTGIPEKLTSQDLVLTGEGSFDEQSLNGKGPHAVISAAAKAGIMTAVLAGRCTLTTADTTSAGIAAVATLTEEFEDPFAETFEKLTELTVRLVSGLEAPSA